MRIERFDLRLLELELLNPFETSFARLSRKQTIILQGYESGGAVGYGEAPLFQAPWYTSEYVAAALDVLENHLLPPVLGVEITGLPDLRHKIARVKEHNAAKAAVESVFWHLRSQLDGKALWEEWGGKMTAVEAGISLGTEPDVRILKTQVQEAVASGYRRVKLKIKPGWDVEPVREIRSQFADLALSVDANGAYSSADLSLWDELDQLGPVFIEQPFPADALLEHAQLQSRLRTPLCLDESVTSLERVREAVELSAGRVYCVKPSSVGGFQAAVDIARLCQASGLDAWVGGMLETGVGKAFAVHLASCPGFSMPADISETRRYFVRDVLATPITVEDGLIQVPSQPGLGWTVDEKALSALTVSSRSITPGG